MDQRQAALACLQLARRLLSQLELLVFVLEEDLSPRHGHQKSRHASPRHQ
ncbi:hypothetical protein B551_0222600 [Cupriavidus sp. HPC(L)]|nr:hypothetical protein B551_0222600 [Cupriavidus sp. HPC(L)]